MILPEYEQTVFLAESGAGPWQGNFAVVTACNPGEIVAVSQNQSRNMELRRALECDRRVRRFSSIEGCSPDLLHREASLAIWGLNQQQAVELGRQWGQNAVFWVEKGRLAVLSCHSGRRVELGRFLDRLRQDGGAGL